MPESCNACSIVWVLERSGRPRLRIACAAEPVLAGLDAFIAVPLVSGERFDAVLDRILESRSSRLAMLTMAAFT